MSKEDIWDITNRQQTQIKLDILKKYLKPWVDIIGEHFPEAYYIDCFAGRGKYHKDGCKDCVPGSPLTALSIATDVQRRKQKKGKNFKLKIIAIESNRNNYETLKEFINASNPNAEVEVEIIHGYFEDLVNDVVTKTGSVPAFFFIDPYGIKPLTKEALDFIINRRGSTEIFLNYMAMGIKRVAGLKKVADYKNENIRTRAIKALSNLDDLFGDNSWIEEKDLLKHFVNSVLKEKYAVVLNFDVPYPDRRGTFYNLLFASKNNTAQKIMKHILTKKLFKGTLFENRPFEIKWDI